MFGVVVQTEQVDKVFSPWARQAGEILDRQKHKIPNNHKQKWEMMAKLCTYGVDDYIMIDGDYESGN